MIVLCIKSFPLSRVVTEDGLKRCVPIFSADLAHQCTHSSNHDKIAAKIKQYGIRK